MLGGALVRGRGRARVRVRVRVRVTVTVTVRDRVRVRVRVGVIRVNATMKVQMVTPSRTLKLATSATMSPRVTTNTPSGL